MLSQSSPSELSSRRFNLSRSSNFGRKNPLPQIVGFVWSTVVVVGGN